MKNKESFLQKVKQKKLYQWMFFLIAMSVSVMGYYLIKDKLDKRFNVIADNFSWVYQVDNIKEQKGKIILSGFAFELKQDTTEEAFELILYDIETGKGYYPKMQYSSRKDVNDYFLCEYDYTKSGFTASISSRKLDLKNKVYEILLRPVGKREAYRMGVYYANGEISFVNPEEFVPLNVVGTDLEKVIEEGVLRVYQPYYGMYVYQYEGELYWIAEEWYGFINNDTYVQFQMNTTQIQSLPKNRLENNWFWSNIGFLFQSKELTDWNTGRYRVAKATLPTEYSITYIWTGNYKDGWIWKNNFRPWYEFGEE